MQLELFQKLELRIGFLKTFFLLLLLRISISIWSMKLFLVPIETLQELWSIFEFNLAAAVTISFFSSFYSAITMYTTANQGSRSGLRFEVANYIKHDLSSFFRWLWDPHRQMIISNVIDKFFNSCKKKKIRLWFIVILYVKTAFRSFELMIIIFLFLYRVYAFFFPFLYGLSFEVLRDCAFNVTD